MQFPGFPKDEKIRLKKLEELSLINSPMEERFDRITKMAKEAFGVPICLISLIGENMQWFKSAQGLCAPSTDRSISFCGHAILKPEPLIVEDATLDERFADNPLVTGPPHIRFYAGAPLQIGEGSAIGTLCIIDSKPRSLKTSEIELFKSMRDMITSQIEQGIDDLVQNDFIAELNELGRLNEIDVQSRSWTLKSAKKMILRSIKEPLYQPRPAALLAITYDEADTLESQYPENMDLIVLEVANRLRSYTLPADLSCVWADRGMLVFLRHPRRETATDLAKTIVTDFERDLLKIDDGVIPIHPSIGIIPLALNEDSNLDALFLAAEKSVENASSGGGMYLTPQFS